MKRAAKRLAAMTRTRLEAVFLEFGLSLKQLDRIEKKLAATPDPEVQLPLFFDLIQRAFKKRRTRNLANLNPLAREFQAYANHVVIADPPCEHITRFLESAAISRDETGYRKPDDWPAFARLALAAHEEIDRFFAGRNATEKHAVSCVHYALDWYLMAAPHLAYKKTPQRLAALAVYIVQYINRSVADLEMGIPLEELARLAGYRSGPSFSGAGRTAFLDVIYAMQDPTLLLVLAEKIPEDWEQKVQELAPGWEMSRDDFPEERELPEAPTAGEIARRREELELKATRVLEIIGSEFTIDDVKRVIFEEEDRDDMQVLLDMFDTESEAVPLQQLLDLASATWNYFPHKSLGGKAPVEMLGK